ncbi:unnamed protein product [Orchesella dallaii]|uniref:Poly [ADP-ribose] polymerase n=1 Tax=Orchesella dallaii TaxID=48710 RepID=A0ABP1QPG9_9HEXA
MAYALGYDAADLDSDDDVSNKTNGFRRRNVNEFKTNGSASSNRQDTSRNTVTSISAPRQYAAFSSSSHASLGTAQSAFGNHFQVGRINSGIAEASRIEAHSNATAPPRPLSSRFLGNANGIRIGNRDDDSANARRPRTSPMATDSRRQDETDVSLPSNLRNMDKLDTATLERLEWMEPLGFRALSKITGLPPEALRKHFWASKVKPTSDLFSNLNHYFKNSHSSVHSGTQLKIKRIVELKRFNENNSDYQIPNVRLLWHGTQTVNVRGILTNGFQLPTRQGMFGRGVYFADRVTKSVQYCGVPATRGNKGTLFLSAVNLGKMYRATATGMNNLTAPPHGYDSVKGCGTHVPDRNDIRKHRGAMIPCGKTFLKPGHGTLQHNE